MIRWLLSLFAWREVHDQGLWHGVWSYQENRITGKRRVVRVGGGYNPIDHDWLERRERSLPSGELPRQCK